MNPETKNRVAVCLKTAWLVAATAILFMGTAVCTSSDTACVPAGKTMLASMLVLTFPTGAFFFMFAMTVVDPTYVLSPADFVLAWVLMLIGGLIQWFIIVPNITDDPAPLTLKLNETAPASPIAVEEIRSERMPQTTEVISVREKAIVNQSPAASSISIKPPKRRRKLLKSIAPVDRQGRTPLERVIARS